VNELHPHPSYIRHQLSVSTSQLTVLAEKGDLAFRDPLTTTQDGAILDGYARWTLARKQGRETLLCIQYELDEVEALCWILSSHRRSNGLNAFSRILLALELEPSFREKARSNQQAGGQNKGSSKLTEPETVDVRSEIADAAGASVGNVSKVKQLMQTVQPDVRQALLRGDISIHRAWEWSKLPPQKQREALWIYQSKRSVRKAARALISPHRPENLPSIPDLENLLRRLSALEYDERSQISVAVIKAPGNTVFVTEDLIQALRPYQESIPHA
jgi:hypothetical protein